MASKRLQPSFLPLFLGFLATALAILRWPAATSPLALNTLSRLSHQQIATRFASLPLRFEVNQGQVQEQVKFLSRGPGFALFLTETEAVIALRRPPTPESSPTVNSLQGKNLKTRNQVSGAKRLLRNLPLQSASHGAGVPNGLSRPHDRLLGLFGENIRIPARRREEHAILRMKLTGANPSPVVEGADPLPGTSNYLLGKNPVQWHTSIPTYAKVRYRDIYPGVDLVYYGNPQQLEFDFIIAPGSSPEAIQVDVSGAETARLDDSGDLILSAAGQPLRLRKPLVYQEAKGRRWAVPGRYIMRGKYRVGFEVGPHDPGLPLVVDPVLAYSTYLGGSGTDVVEAIGVDSSGSVYATGYTDATDFPLASPLKSSNGGFEDVYISKLSPDGSQLVYSTYLGGDDRDISTALAVDESGVVTVAGYTYSTNFPVASSFQSTLNGAGTADGFVARLNASGSALIYSTYLGGNGDDAVLGMGVDADGSAYLAGQTTSSNFPLANARQSNQASFADAFVTKFSPVGALIYSTYLGGNDIDQAQGVAVDGEGSAYVTGYTLSTTFPLANAIQSSIVASTCIEQSMLVPCYDAFVTKFSPTGTQLVYSTYLGGNGDDIANGVAVDSSGNAYIIGQTNSTDFPTTNALESSPLGGWDGFLTKLSADGGSWGASTYLGGQANDYANAVAVNAAGEAFVAGRTASSDFPVLNSLQPLRGTFNGFVVRLNAASSALLYSTFLGGTAFGGPSGDRALAIAVDSSDNAYVGGYTTSDDFPVSDNAYQSQFTAVGCISGNVTIPCPEGFLAKLTPLPALNPGGIVNGASFLPNSAVAPGSIVSAFGTDLASSISYAKDVPLTTMLGSLSIRINGILAPLYFLSPGQINLQIPWELAGESEATVEINSGEAVIAPITVNLADVAPGIFSVNAQGTGQGAILISNTSTFAAPVNSISGASARPAIRGTDYVTIYCTGLGPVSNQPASGAASPGAPDLARTIATPVVTIGGRQAMVSFAGLAPGFVGLYQVDVQVPTNAPTGSAVPVAMTVSGTVSNTVEMAIQ